MHKLNTFEMLSKENANEIYSRLNVIVEETWSQQDESSGCGREDSMCLTH